MMRRIDISFEPARGTMWRANPARDRPRCPRAGGRSTAGAAARRGFQREPACYRGRLARREDLKVDRTVTLSDYAAGGLSPRLGPLERRRGHPRRPTIAILPLAPW